MLGTVGKGFDVAVRVLNGGRLTLAAGCTAGTKRILGQMVEFTEQRVQFGKPIADFEITQRKLAGGGVLQGVRERDALARGG